MEKVSSFILAVIVSSLSRGYTLSKLWAWFAEPLHAPHLTIPAALGLALLISVFTLQTSSTGKGKEVTFAEGIVQTWLHAALLPLLVLPVGWIYLQFV